ncbi:MAG: Flp family type IVb pilin [Anaerolineae bacterium]|jgi:Flp pilus assembly pilin Flp
MTSLYLYIKNWIKAQEGQDLIEYALIIVLLVVVAVIGLGLLGTEINNLWGEIQTWLGSRGDLNNLPQQ